MVKAESLSSALKMMPAIIETTRTKRVIDVGCGPGAWAFAAVCNGCEILAVDGYVPEDQLFIPPSDFRRVDLGEGVDCGGYDLAVCMEVAEHLSPESAEKLVGGLTRARYVLFSAAIPGQGGVGHINEQWQSYWASLFVEYGRCVNDDVRNMFWGDQDIAPYYRQNVMLVGLDEDLRKMGLASLGTVRDVVHPEVFKHKMGM